MTADGMSRRRYYVRMGLLAAMPLLLVCVPSDGPGNARVTPDPAEARMDPRPAIGLHKDVPKRQNQSMATSKWVPILCIGLFLAFAFGFMAIDLFWVLPECERRCESHAGLSDAGPKGWGVARYQCEDGSTGTVHHVEWFGQTARAVLERIGL